MSRFTKAMVAYAVLGGLTWWTITDPKLRAGTLLVLGLFALKSALRRNDALHAEKDGD